MNQDLISLNKQEIGIKCLKCDCMVNVVCTLGKVFGMASESIVFNIRCQNCNRQTEHTDYFILNQMINAPFISSIITSEEFLLMIKSMFDEWIEIDKVGK